MLDFSGVRIQTLLKDREFYFLIIPQKQYLTPIRCTGRKVIKPFSYFSSTVHEI